MTEPIETPSASPATRRKTRAYDAYLAAAARTGDRQALARLAARWQGRFLGHAYRLTGDAEMAADVAQEAWVEVMRALARLDDPQAFPAWALRIVSRRAAKAIGGAQRRRAVRDAAAQDAAVITTAANGGEAASDLTAVRAALARLPVEQRAAMGLFYLEDFSVAEIAVALGVAPGTVKTRLMHARRKVRAILEGGDNAENDTQEKR